jgi:hypothetical protein
MRAWGSIRLAGTVVLLLACAAGQGFGQNQVKEQLDKSVDIDKAIEAPFRDVAGFLADRFDVKLVVDRDAFKAEKAELPDDKKVKVPKIPNAMLDTALRFMLSQANAVYEVRANQIVIVPNRKNGKPSAFPPVSDARKALIKMQRESLSKLTPLEIERPIEGPFKGILDFICDRFDVTIIVDTLAFEKRTMDENVWDKRVKLSAMKGSFDAILKKTLAQIKGTYELHGDHILIVPFDATKS